MDNTTMLYASLCPISLEGSSQQLQSMSEGILCRCKRLRWTLQVRKMRNREEMKNKHQITSLDLNYMLFGYALAGSLRLMLAHVLLNYDVQMANRGGLPANRVFGQDNTMLDPTAQSVVNPRARKEEGT
ncbi:hypothetical protein M378DRAFT_417954 [Amanita muscaria Koide BX008]|uniref:Uncharacterized protein n=1 Tax=Amanita muscaria (strain Koide BX008) TaxID=946122 RepID=A0A0C2XBU2_AMAMK|nr:hypothetical protein M378DRAFT_417954 [Amanita muscaria Koide BX008]